MAGLNIVEGEGPYITLNEDKKTVSFNGGPLLRLNYSITFRLDGQVLCGFDQNGKFFVGEGVETDEAARAFWASVRQYAEADRQQAVLAERERCAKVCESQASGDVDRYGSGFDSAVQRCTEAIRKG